MKRFLSCGTEPIGFYPIVNSSLWIQRLLPLGVKTIQLRIKDQPTEIIEQEIAASVAIAKKYNTRLFINDYWQLAIKYQAYGVHLGYEDIQQCPIPILQEANLRLGISTHTHIEMDFALSFQPSYVAVGPIYPTHTKPMAYVPTGIQRLTEWVKKIRLPIVAIGGISLEKLPQVRATGVNGIAVISAITQSDNPEKVARLFIASYA